MTTQAERAEEPRYTLAEARRVLNERECREHGCDLEQQRYLDGTTVMVFCSRCDLTFELTMAVDIVNILARTVHDPHDRDSVGSVLDLLDYIGREVL